MLVAVGTVDAVEEPWACSSGQHAVVGGVKYKTKVALIKDGDPSTGFVNASHTMVKIKVQATLADGGAAFPFHFSDPHEYVMPPKKAGSMVGFDVGFAPVPGECPDDVCEMTKDSVRMLCIPPEEGYGSTAMHGIPANSTLLLEITCKEIIPPPTGAGSFLSTLFV